MEMLSSDVLRAESKAGSSPSQGTEFGDARKAGGMPVSSERARRKEVLGRKWDFSPRPSISVPSGQGNTYPCFTQEEMVSRGSQV